VSAKSATRSAIALRVLPGATRTPIRARASAISWFAAVASGMPSSAVSASDGPVPEPLVDGAVAFADERAPRHPRIAPERVRVERQRASAARSAAESSGTSS
jgi:hypothetical protein